MEEKQLIQNIDSSILPGKALSLKAFRNWIGESENAPALDLKSAKIKWTKKRKQLLRLTK